MNRFESPNSLRRIANGARAHGRLPEELEPADFVDQLDYTDRESYLAWVRDWKTAYGELSAGIRAEKTACRAAQRAGDANADRLQSDLYWRRQDARLMIALRRAGKRDSASRREQSMVTA